MTRFVLILDQPQLTSFPFLFQAFKFPDSMEVHFQCTIQICRYQCPDQCSDSTGLHSGILELAHALPEAAYGPPPPPPPHYLHAAGRPRDERRAKRSLNDDPEVGVNRVIRVVSTGDLTFALEENGSGFQEAKEELVNPGGVICMTTPGFAVTLVVLLAVLLISCLMSAFLCVRLRPFSADKMTSISYIGKNKKTSLSKSCFYS